MIPDIPAEWTRPLTGPERRELMVPMRDGVQLLTVLLIPEGVTRAPVVLERTPYSARRLATLGTSPDSRFTVTPLHRDLLDAGYVLAFQDVRGKHGSEGEYAFADAAVNASDAWDTIDHLVRELPECDGKVATLGLSYDGFTALASLLDPHPALAASVPMNPLVDGWAGDDWFHNGAFRQTMTAEYVYKQTSSVSSEHEWPLAAQDGYAFWLRAGNAETAGRQMGLDALPVWRRMVEHPDYDGFWSGQAVDRLLAERAPGVPTLFVHSQWDAEDIDGCLAAYAAVAPAGRSRLVIGPWTHGAPMSAAGDVLGPMRFGSDTAAWFRREVLLPFLDEHLRDGLPDDRPVLAFETGTNRWREHASWPPAATRTPLWLGDGLELQLGGDAPAAGTAAYVSDPAKPVTYQPRPVRPFSAGSDWPEWLVGDQRFAGDRTDVLRYLGPRLTEPLTLAGEPTVTLLAATTGTDADWVVKLIDVLPDEVPGDGRLGGYELAVSMDVLRGRYRDDPSQPQAIPAGEVVRYDFALPHVSHTFLPGHRLAVQVQSSWFPLYDRNPQTFVPSIMSAPAEAYVAATHTVHPGSHLTLPVLRD